MTLTAAPELPPAASAAKRPGKAPGAAGTGVTLLVAPATNKLLVTVRAKTGQVAETSCGLTPNVVWPGNCTAFVNVTPPL